MSEKTKTAIITGAGSGVGRAAAMALLKKGYCVALAGRTVATLEETASLAGAAKDQAPVVVTDVADPAAVNNLFKTALDAFGYLDVLFNNAGAMGPKGVMLEDITPEQWLHMVNVNFNGAFYCAQAAFRQMKNQSPQGGRIINNGSISAYVPRPNSVAYSSTKHAITGLTKVLSLDGRKYGIACSQIDIGNAGTPLTATIASGIIQANGSMMAEPTFEVAHVGDAIAYMAGLPLGANVQFMTLMATNMPYVGRG